MLVSTLSELCSLKSDRERGTLEKDCCLKGFCGANSLGLLNNLQRPSLWCRRKESHALVFLYGRHLLIDASISCGKGTCIGNLWQEFDNGGGDDARRFASAR